MAGRTAGFVAMLVMGVIFIFIGGGLAFYVGKPTLDKAKASTSWPTAAGRIIDSAVERHHGKKNSNYEAVVVYEYAVDGEKFESDEIWFGQYTSSDRSEMQSLVKQYPLGAVVDVYYSPDDPSAAVLQPGAFTSTYMAYGIGLFFFVAGCLLVAAPLIKLFVLTAVVATSSSDSFAGGIATMDGDEFSSVDLSRRGFDNQDSDDDGFAGIPGS